MAPPAGVRAAMDQVIFDSANVLYLASNLPEQAEERVGIEGWPIWKIVLHMLTEVASHGPRLARMREEGPPVSEAEPDDSIENQRHERGPMSEMLADILHFRGVFLRELEHTSLPLLMAGNPDAKLEAPLKRWALHFFEHGLSMVEVLPEFWDDGIVLTWVFEADLSYDANLAERRKVLLGRVRAQHAEAEAAEAAAKKGKKR